MDPVAFIERTLALLAFERDTDLAQTSLLASKCSPRLLQNRGLAILSLSPANVSIGLGGKTLVELQKSIRGIHLPAHTFRQGDTAEIIDEAALKAKDSNKKQQNTESMTSLQGVVYKVYEDRIVIALNPRSGGSEDKDPDIPQKCTLRKLANTVTYDRMEKTLSRLLKLLSGPSPPELIEILFSLRQPTFSPLPSSLLSSGLTYYNENLNDSQKDAVKFAVYQADQIALIHGPPGTGKTSTLIEIILHIIKNPDKPQQRVLVCSASNLAVDNILERLLPYSSPSSKDKEGGFGITRLGHPARIMPQLSRNTLDYQINHSHSGMVTKELKEEIEGLAKRLGSGKLRGKERKEGWGEVRELRKEYRKREGTVVAGVVKQASVVLATCHGAGSRQLENQTFDVLIIDEAAQALEAVCWIPLLKTAKKVILAGDHLQLPPTLKSKNEELPKELRVEKDKNGKKDGKKKNTQEDGSASDTEEEGKDGTHKADKGDGQAEVKKIQPKSLEVTLFDRLLSMYGGKVKRLLNVQYRMNEKIMSFPSKTLYDSQLVAHPSVQSRLLSELPNLSHTALENDDGLLTEPVIFYDTAGASMYERAEEDAADGNEVKRTIDGESKSNENEADIVMKFIDELITAGVPQDSISVITPYNAQLSTIKSLLNEKYPPSIPSADPSDTSANTRGIEAASVDGFQGREKDVIVLSLVRSNDKKEVGFLADKRRLNVAMTRAKRCLCVVGDSETVRNGGKFLKDWMDWLEENADVRVVQ